MKAYGICEATFLWGCCVLIYVSVSESVDPQEVLQEVDANLDTLRPFSESTGQRMLGSVERGDEAMADMDYGTGWSRRGELEGLDSDGDERKTGEESKDSVGRMEMEKLVDEICSGSRSAGSYDANKKLDRERSGMGELDRSVEREKHKRGRLRTINGQRRSRHRPREGEKRDRGVTREGRKRARRAVDGGPPPKDRLSNRTIFGGVSRDKERQLNAIAAKDMVAALLDFVEVPETGLGSSTTRNCTLRLNQDVRSLLAPDDVFREQTIKAIQTANTLSNVFRHPLEVPLHDRFLFALIEGLVQSDALIHGAAIAFDPGQMPNPQRPLSPYVHRGQAPGFLLVRNVTRESRGRYAVNGTEGYDWFWRQRRDFSKLLWPHRDVCDKFKVGDEVQSVADTPTAVSSTDEGLWGNLQFDCTAATKVWTIAYSVPFFGCNEQKSQPKKLLVFKGVLKIDLDLSHVDLDQCGRGHRPVLLLARHRCPSSTQCVPLERRGFRRGAYRCECLPGYYHPSQGSANATRSFFPGWQMETLHIARLLAGPAGLPAWQLDSAAVECSQCAPGCATCVDDRPCTAEYDVIVRSIPLVIESLCISVDVVLLVVVVWMRKAKIRRPCLWCLVEAAIAGNILIHSTAVVQYFEPTEVTCFLVPWLREVGFSVVYGALILRIYRVLTEFQSRKAHRVQMRDKDLVKYLSAIVVVVIGYMVAWTAVTYDNLTKTGTLLETGVTGPDRLLYIVCQSRWWDYAVETGELVFLSIGIYECYCARSAPSDYREVRFITWAIINEALVSIFFYVARHCLWMSIHPDYLYLMYFIRCQLTASGMLLLVLGPKLWYSYRPPMDDGSLRSRTYSSSVEGCQDSLRSLPAAPATPSEIVKLNNIGSNGEVDVEEINLAEMNPDDIRNELKRLYTQLQIYKTKTMRQDNPHISKRRGGRKQTNRRFSFQPFHAKNKPHHTGGPSSGPGGGGPGGGPACPAGATGSEMGTDMGEVSRTPEESSNSAEGVSVYMEESSAAETCRGPTGATGAASSGTGVSFKAGRKCKYSS